MQITSAVDRRPDAARAGVVSAVVVRSRQLALAVAATGTAALTALVVFATARLA